MIIEGDGMRARIVKGWAFMGLSDDEQAAVLRFLGNGDTDELPDYFQHADYSIFSHGRVR